MQSLTDAASAIQAFQKNDLGERIGAIETLLKEADSEKLQAAFPLLGVDDALLEAGLTLKLAAGQVNVIIHAVGILLSLPRILAQGERVQSLSLGAGSTGKPFDLETTIRVAEFKFIHWRGGSEAIRQNSLFKDFYLLAEHPTPKAKEIFVVGTEHALKFLRGRRALSSVMSRNNKLWGEFHAKYQERFTTVSDYYSFRENEVRLRDLLDVLPGLADSHIAEDQEEPQ